MRTQRLTRDGLVEAIAGDVAHLKQSEFGMLDVSLMALADRAAAVESDVAAQDVLEDWVGVRRSARRAGFGGWLQRPVFRHPRRRYVMVSDG